MKSMHPYLFISLLLVLPSFAQTASTAAQEKKPDQTRNIRFLIAGVRPMPVFGVRNGEEVELDPPIELLPPTEIEIIPPEGQAKNGMKPEVTKIAAPTNMMTPLPAFKSADQVRLKLMKSSFEEAPVQEVVGDLSGKLWPFVVISANPGKSAWNDPQVRTLDLSEKAVPVRSVLVVNLSKIPLRVGFDAGGGVVDAEKTGLFPCAPGNTPVKYRVDAVGKSNEAVTIASNAYRLDKDSRLIILAIPNSNAQGRAPVSLRILTDPVNMKNADIATKGNGKSPNSGE